MSSLWSTNLYAPMYKIKFLLVLLLRFEGLKPRQIDDIRPSCRAGGATHSRYYHQLGKLLISLYIIENRQIDRQKKNENFEINWKGFTWKRGFLTNNSPRIQPQDQTSIAGPYLSSPSSSSGGRYHRVITQNSLLCIQS